MAQELRIEEHGQEVAYRNTPGDRTGYEKFRLVVTHLSAIQDENQLYAEPLVYDRTWTIPANSVTAEGFQALQKEYLVTYNKKDNSYTLRKQITGQILITNYDLNTLSSEERARLIEETEDGQLSDVSFDIRPGHVGGEYPLRESSGCEASIAFSIFWADRLKKNPSTISTKIREPQLSAKIPRTPSDPTIMQSSRRLMQKTSASKSCA